MEDWSCQGEGTWEKGVGEGDEQRVRERENVQSLMIQKRRLLSLDASVFTQ